MNENIYDQAQTYLNDFGKVLYSPLATKKIIEGLLAELANLESFVSGEDVAP